MTEPSGEDFVLVHYAASPAEAELVRSLLEAAGFFAFIPDKNTPLPTVDLTPWDGEYRALGCEVVVPARDLARAKEALDEARTHGQLELDEDEYPGLGDADADDESD